AETLNKLGLNIKTFCPLDLTKQEQIHAVANSVKEQILRKELPSLYSVIFVAGGGHIAPIELMEISNFRDELEKRLVGNITLLQQLIPLLRLTKGRVLWISTPGLFPVPYVADIHAPDFAVNYLARTLNLELRPDGIKNILIRCGGINTPAPKRTENNIIEQLKNCPKERLAIYESRLVKLESDLKRFAARRTEPEKVAELIAKVLRKEKPKVRYQVGHMSGLGAFLEKLPQSWVDYIMAKRKS
ncbi:MAG: SDR family NAD(P)-dependent oxidoreductase, partial [Bacteroidales bacterium]|nr:SDR family NAD(P)-dependent oxidoreductase [Bacteroidales bacterium]